MHRFTRILCPVDFSDESRHAFEHAVTIARWYDASITALNVYWPLYTPAPMFAGLDYAAPPVVEAIDTTDYERELQAFMDKAGAPGVQTSAVIAVGTPWREITAAAGRIGADLIVMGTHGATGFEHLLLGSVTEKVLRTSQVPVLTVPPRAQATSKLPFARLLCPVDFSPSSKSAVRIALSLAQEGQAAITLLHVFDAPVDEPLTTRPMAVPEFHAEYEAWARAEMQALVPPEAADWCTPAIRYRRGRPYEQIVAAAAEEQADLIVVGVHGRTALDLLLGSTTNQVVRRATCPVLTVRMAET